MNTNTQRGFSGIAAIGIVAAVVAVVIMFGYFVNPKQIQNNEAMVPVEDAVVGTPVGKALAETTAAETKTADAMVRAGSYEAYSAEKIALAATGDVVLFFHASWCPTCRGLNGDIEKNMSAIPAGVTILKTDYDTESELKKKYGVTTQHTLVQVDKDGNLIKKWSGGSKLENVLSQVQ